MIHQTNPTIDFTSPQSCTSACGLPWWCRITGVFKLVWLAYPFYYELVAYVDCVVSKLIVKITRISINYIVRNGVRYVMCLMCYFLSFLCVIWIIWLFIIMLCLRVYPRISPRTSVWKPLQSRTMSKRYLIPKFEQNLSMIKDFLEKNG